MAVVLINLLMIAKICLHLLFFFFCNTQQRALQMKELYTATYVI